MMMDWEIEFNGADRENNLLVTTEGHRIRGSVTDLLEWLEENNYLVEERHMADTLRASEEAFLTAREQEDAEERANQPPPRLG